MPIHDVHEQPRLPEDGPRVPARGGGGEKEKGDRSRQQCADIVFVIE